VIVLDGNFRWVAPKVNPADYVGRHHLSDWWQWRNPTGQPFRINMTERKS
jgi:hypothetical protein